MESQEFSPLNINIDNYSGPLEVLLDLAKAQKVNLEEISITQLADQFIEFINNTKKINLDIASIWSYINLGRTSIYRQLGAISILIYWVY